MGNCLRYQSSMKRVSSDESLGAPDDQFSVRNMNVITRDVHTREKAVMMMNNIEEEKEGIFNGDNDPKKGAIRGNNLITSSVSSTTRSSTSSSGATELVKIKITKKQLLELLGKVEVTELSMQQILSHLMNVTAGGSHKSSSYEANNQRSWRPNLQSIPE